MKRWLLAALLAVPVLALSSAVDCSFLQNPSDFLYSREQHWREVSKSTDILTRTRRPTLIRHALNAQQTAPTPRKNFIDDYIFGRIEGDGIQAAPLASDQDFVRRVFLDLTGRIPAAEQALAFLEDLNPTKRDALIDSLIGSEEFIDKWTMFLGDLYKNNGPATNVNRYFQGRDAFYLYLKDAVTSNKPYNQVAQELISATGDSFVDGATNWTVGGTIPMGPIQDTYDGQAVNVAQMFLGINVVDCLLCHDGERHLDAVNLWGKQQTRSNMWGLSAFFARTRMQRTVVSQTPLYAKFTVSDLTTGEYQLNTTTGNRSARAAAPGALNRAEPKYPFNGEPIAANANRRNALADMVTNDPQFARAIVNYIWEKFMVEALVSPSNGFDPARLDPDNPPPAPWELQPANPELLEALSEWFRNNNYDLRALMALITKSNAYGLSSDYPGTWRLEYVPYYARKFVRRLDAEEIHDAVVKATGILPVYSLASDGAAYALPPVNWAMKLPDTREPRSNNPSVQFLNAFGRGDRDQNVRESTGSSMQALNMMNHTFIMSRIHNNNNGSTVQRLLRQTTDSGAIIEALFLSALGRYPSPDEATAAAGVMRRLGNQRGAESLQWALLNKLEFLFSY